MSENHGHNLYLLRSHATESCNLVPPQAGCGLRGSACLTAKGTREHFKADLLFLLTGAQLGMKK